MVVRQPHDSSSRQRMVARTSGGRSAASSLITCRRWWICFCRAMWLSARLAYWMSFCRPITCQIDSGSAPVGCHTLTPKITASRRGLSSSTASIGVFE